MSEHKQREIAYFEIVLLTDTALIEPGRKTLKFTPWGSSLQMTTHVPRSV